MNGVGRHRHLLPTIEQDAYFVALRETGDLGLDLFEFPFNPCSVPDLDHASQLSGPETAVCPSGLPRWQIRDLGSWSGMRKPP